jgi:hypothetical protein
MSALPRRFKSVIERMGDPYTAGLESRKAVVAVLDGKRAAGVLTQTEIDALAKPIWLAYVPHDDASAVNDSVNWDGLSLSVKKVVKARARGETVAKMVVWA